MIVILLVVVAFIVAFVGCGAGLVLGYLGRDKLCWYGVRIERRLKRVLFHVRTNDKRYPVLTRDEQRQINDSVKVSFLGDLILLRDVIEKQPDGDYSRMFEYIAPYLKRADLAIGVFEGPCAGVGKGWSTSVFDDGVPLHLNFPDSYARAVKNAGIDLVSTANNHVLDQGLDGALRTLDVLDGVGLDHVGSYRNAEEYHQVKIVKVKGLRVAVLAYTYGSEHCSFPDLLEGRMRHVTKVIGRRLSRDYRETHRRVKRDFDEAKKLKPDVIIAMPHIGREFRHFPDWNQKAWCDYFVELGADIVLADHPHAVQPIEWRQRKNGDNAVIVYCPGNFINSYIKGDGDASMLVELYLNPTTGKPFASSIVPIYAYAEAGRNYVGLPVCQIDEIESKLSEAEYKRICEVQNIVTQTVLGESIKLCNREDRYYYLPQGYKRQQVSPIPMAAEYKNRRLYQELDRASSVCFLGDSVTEGTKNGGFGWYEPLLGLFSEKRIVNFSAGGETIRYFSSRRDEAASFACDLYVLAIGCNDIRYRNPAACAMTPETFVENVQQLVDAIKRVRQDAHFVFISPWESKWFDPYCPIRRDEKELLYASYSRALSDYCKKNSFLFLDPNPIIKENWMKRDVLLDHIHPSAATGIRLFAQAALLVGD